MADTLQPAINIGPGQIIARNMEALNWSNKDLAEVLGMSDKSVSQLLNNKQGVTVDSAVLLGKAFGTSAEFWLNLEQAYRMRLRKTGKREKDTEIRAEVRRYLPLAEMRKKGWLSCSRAAESQVEAVKRFLGTSELDFSDYREVRLPFCARQGSQSETGGDVTKYYSITWYRKALAEASVIDAKRYSREKLEELAASIVERTRSPEGVAEFIQKLGDAGVKFFVLSHLAKTYLDGASFWSGESPAIVYTARYDRLDNFWWTVAHEISHVLLHLKEGSLPFLDDLEDREQLSKQERAADDYAAKLLGVKRLLSSAEPYRRYFSEPRLLEVAETCGLDPSVALGILQHYGYVDYRSLARYRRTVLDRIDADLVRG
jgi:HTH-type transcriptional regulator / antitoxin HigA